MSKHESDSQYYFDQQAADYAVQFIEQCCVHIKGKWAGEPVKLEQWQKDEIIRPLFGWKRSSDSLRRYRTAYIELPRKNGKSLIASAVALYLLCADGEHGAEIYCAATATKQADIVFQNAKNMVLKSPRLSERCEPYKSSIYVPATTSKLEVVAADADTLHGLNSHGNIIDELHAHKTRELYDVLSTGTGSREQPINFIITTAGYDRESICYELHDYSIKIINGEIENDAWLPVIYAADENDDIDDPETWAKANPNLGVSVSYDYLRQEAQQAKHTPAKENTFRRLHLNQWTQQNTRWLSHEQWDACAGDLTPEQLRELNQNRPCYAGLDLGVNDDLSALVLLFPWDDGHGYDVVPYFYMPEEIIPDREHEHGVSYSSWIRQDYCKLTEGTATDTDEIRYSIDNLADQYEIREIACDRYNAKQLMAQLEKDGHEAIAVGQGFASMAEPSKEFERLVELEKLRHGNHPVLRWMAGNVSVKSDEHNNIKPTKDKQSSKNDGIVALIMALSRAMLHETNEAETTSIYETENVMRI
jgi:phage terminase large subunit-like protein